MLDDLHRGHLAWMKGKNDNSLKSVYTRVKQRVQIRLRQMKDKWWKNKAAELQDAADSHDMKRFYSGLKAVYGPKVSGSVPVWSADGSKLTKDKFCSVGLITLRLYSISHLTLMTLYWTKSLCGLQLQQVLTDLVVIVRSTYVCFVFCAVYRAMNTFRFTGRPVTGVPQRPFLVPPQLTLTPSPPCLVTSHPPAVWRPPLNSTIAFIQSPSNHGIGPLPVIPVPPPRTPTAPQLFPPVTVSTQADCPPSTQFQPNYAFSMSESKSKLSVETQSESKSSKSSIRVRYPLSSKLKSSQRDVRLTKTTDTATKLFTKSHDETDSRPSQQTQFGDFRFSIPPSSVTSVTSAPTGVVVSTVSIDSGVCSVSPAISLRSISSDKLSPSVPTPFSSLCILTPTFVPASGRWKSDGNPAVTGIVKGPESGSEVDGAKCDHKKEDRILQSPEPILESHASLFSTASVSSPSSSSQMVIANKGGKSPQSVGRGKQLLDMLKYKTSTHPTVGGSLLCSCAPLPPSVTS